MLGLRYSRDAGPGALATGGEGSRAKPLNASSVYLEPTAQALQAAPQEADIPRPGRTERVACQKARASSAVAKGRKECRLRVTYGCSTYGRMSLYLGALARLEHQI